MKTKPIENLLIPDNRITAILIDGGFYRKRISHLLPTKSAKEIADFLEQYCRRHLIERINGQSYNHSLYRIFYYDCPPIKKTIYNPLHKNNVNLEKSNSFSWINEFLDELKQKRKFALRLGQLSEVSIGYHLKSDPLKKLLLGKITINDLSDNDIYLNLEQKGVDMKIGLDIASLSYKHQVDQIILISGDSDFVSAAKLARREGIDFVLDPLGAKIKSDLFEHIDGLRTVDRIFTYKT